MLEVPLTAKVFPIIAAGIIAITPINQDPATIIEAAKKVVTVINKEVTNTDTGYKEKVTITREEKPDKDDKPGLIRGTWNAGKKLYWWVVK